MKLKPVDEAAWDARGSLFDFGERLNTPRDWYRNRSGEVISGAQWMIRHQPEYQILFQTIIHRVWVSTAWTGIDTSRHVGGPIFETVVTKWNRRNHTPVWDEDLDHYYKSYTEAQAVRVHNVITCRLHRGEWKWSQ